MELSMWMLADWLKKYDPLCDIKQGKRTIKNVRLLSEGRKYSGLTVYLDTQGDNKVICSSDQDYMILNSDNPNEIFNDILDAFEYYNEWDSLMTDLIYNDCTLLELLQEGQRVIHNYLVIADATFLIREGCGDAEDMQKNQSYFNAFQRKLLPVEVLTKFEEDTRLRSKNMPPYLLEIPTMHKIDIVSNIFVRNVHKGWVICMRSDNSYDHVTMDLMEAFTKHVNRWYMIHDQDERFMDQSGLFLEILEQSYTNASQIIHRLEAINWYERDEKKVYVIHPEENAVSTNTVIKRHSEKIFDGSYAIEYKGDVILFVNEKLCMPDSEALLPSLLETGNYTAGKSASFKNIFELFKYYETAKIAAEQADSTHRLVAFWSAVLPYFKEIITKNAPIMLVHPALNILKNYDVIHHTELYHTLNVFLENKCNYTTTAASLFIHRSTLIYRMEKILELTDIDLDQYPTRLHLAISYLLQ